MKAILAAPIAGPGIAYMPDFLARNAIASGALCRVLTEHISDAGQFSVVWPSSRQLSPKLRAFVDFAARRLFNDTGSAMHDAALS